MNMTDGCPHEVNAPGCGEHLLTLHSEPLDSPPVLLAKTVSVGKRTNSVYTNAHLLVSVVV